jgi:hypothetical protein
VRHLEHLRIGTIDDGLPLGNPADCPPTDAQQLADALLRTASPEEQGQLVHFRVGSSAALVRSAASDVSTLVH